MSIDVLIGILIPFVGTALGAACVFFLKDQISASPKRRMKLNPKRKKEFCHRLPKQSLTQ